MVPGPGNRKTTKNKMQLRVVAENKSHFFATPEAASEWLESSGLASGAQLNGLGRYLEAKAVKPDGTEEEVKLALALRHARQT
ncbi:hypothetical protein NDU88_001849 [Pleurodeles waltl]|uniref:Uncharacterized protein n=1 Tax=Pleurodeles waltl TaxID=8319 RepID=A0AAV7KQM8_PLEWA|nr:hypothetical protein NDU88_001849 [Pleurodeles waltl]